jgi:hypothetical protein
MPDATFGQPFLLHALAQKGQAVAESAREYSIVAVGMLRLRKQSGYSSVAEYKTLHCNDFLLLRADS